MAVKFSDGGKGFLGRAPRPTPEQMQQMLAGKNYNQLLQMADNAARERGTTVEQMAQQLGLPFRR